jgi:hypothetical protein
LGGAVLVLVAGIGGAQAGNKAQGRHSASAVSPLSGNVAPGKPGTVSGAKTLRVSLISQDNNVVTVGSGFQAIDAVTTLNCPATSCTFSAEQNVQVQNSIASNRWAICTALDGNFMNQPLCPFLGILPSDSSYVGGSFSQSQIGVPGGSHTLQTFLYTDFGANRSIYSIIYRIYTP